LRDRRRAAFIAPGAAGVLCGIAAVAADAPWLGLAAGIFAGVASFQAVTLFGRLHDGSAPAAVAPAAPAVSLDDVDLAEPAPPTEAELHSIQEVAAGPGGSPSDMTPDALTDTETGLLNRRYFEIALEARISAARRHLRPVAVVLVEVVRGLPEDEPRSVDAAVVAAGITRTLREADTACRLEDGRFGLLLEDTPENGAVWTVERLRRNLVPDNPGFTLWAGVACYPAHAFSPDELYNRASAALEAAREWRQDRIEVATSE
jgi:two-component system cell cycle response regulator